jgi:hypothetical protein
MDKPRAPVMGFHWKPPGQRATISVVTASMVTYGESQPQPSNAV